jgi:tetratricopeptide (TPR) repeat protein
MEEISLQAYCGQIEDMIDQGRYAEAVAHGKHILEQYPKYVTGYRLLGKVMFEARQNDQAADMFLRVLSADPEDMLSWVAMSEVYDRRTELDAAVWYMERAFELATDNDLVGEQLRQLYGRRDGFEPERIELTRGALARLYLKGDLLPRAISELRALAAESPDRTDLEVALAEALWRNDQRLEASDACQKVLDRLPYCLKANLILGEIWTNSGREEGMIYLRRAEALDPENRMARDLFGVASPLPAREVQVAPLEYKPPASREARPDWMSGVEAGATGVPLGEGEGTLFDIAAALEAQIEIPSWLEEIDVGEGVEAALPGLGVPSEATAPEEPAPASAETPDWLAELGPESGGEEAPSGPGEEELPDFISGLAAEAGAEEMAPVSAGPGEQSLDWLTDLRADVGAEEVSEPAPAEIPEWMQQLAPAEAGPPAEVLGEEGPVPAEIPDWMQELAPAEAGPAAEVPEGEEPVPAEIPDWMQELAPAEAGPVAEAPGEEAGAPEWLEGEGMPSGEEALAWLGQLAVGKEEELQAQVAAEAEARTTEIMGRSRAEEPVAEVPEAPAAEAPVEEEPMAGLFAEEVAAPVEPPGEPVPAEIPDWMQELAPAEAGPAAEVPGEEAGAPKWLEGEGMPSGEEALAWLGQLAAGKEEELQAQVAAEVEARTAEIMGRPKAEEPVVEAPVVEEPVAGLFAEEAAAPPAEEAFGWTAFGEAEPSPEVAPPVVEPAVSVSEEIVPEEAEAPQAAEPGLGEAAAPPAEEAFGWTAFGELETLSEAGPPVAEGIAPLEEIEALPAVELGLEEAAAPPAEETLGWTVFGEAEAPPEAAPPMAEPVVSTAAEIVPKEVQVPPAAEVTLPYAVEERSAEPAAVLAERPPQPVEARPPKKAPAAQPPAEPFGVERAYLKEHPRDYDAWLSLARALWQTGERDEALQAYGRLIRAGKSLDIVTTELEEYAGQWPDVATRRALGDAYMKSGRLDEALTLYRQALENL